MYPPVNGYYYPDPNEFQKQLEKREISRRSTGIGLAVIGMQVFSSVASTLLVLILLAVGLMDLTAYDGTYMGMSSLTYHLYYAFLYLCMMVVPFWILMPCFKLKFRQVMPMKRTARPGLMVLAAFAGLTMTMASNYLATQYGIVMEQIGISTAMPEFPKDGSVLSWILYFVIIAVLPAFAEEFAFRGVTLQLLKPYGEGFAVFASAFVFGLMHGTIIQIPFAFAGGLFFGYLVVRTGSIWPSILLHFLNNALSFVQELILYYEPDFVSEQVVIVLMYGIYFAALIGGIICLARLLKKDTNFFRLNPSPSNGLKDGQKFGKFVSSVGMVLAMIVIGIMLIGQNLLMGLL